MACNCATNEQLSELYRKFGTRIRPSKKDTLAFKIEAFFTNTAVLTTLITMMPLILFYISFNYSKGKNQISLAEFFGLRKTTNALANVG